MKPANHNLYALFQAAFGPTPERLAIETDQGQEYTFGDIDQLTARMANWLQSLGLQRGDRVMVQVEKSVPALLFYLACLRAGVVYVPLNTAYQAAELAYFIENAEPRVFVCDPARQTDLLGLTQKLGVAHLVTLDAAGQGSLMAAALEHAPNQTIQTMLSDELAAILYISGTTGRSKGAQLTHANLGSNALTLHKHWGWQDGDGASVGPPGRRVWRAGARAVDVRRAA